MKKSSCLIFLLFFLFSCANNEKNEGSGKSVAKRLKKEVLNFATGYATDKFKDPKRKVNSDGIITINENQLSYVIDPAKISVGLIDDDSKEDVILSIDYYNGQNLVLTEHLILINTDGKYMLNRVIESDMKILGINNRIITAEIYTRSRNSPLINCSACKEIVKYQFKRGELIRME